jgi:transcriptional regulator with XRE-family HTH domain
MADLLKERIARHLREIREQKDMTQEQVARAVGVTTRQYQRWEGAISTPYWRNIEALAEAFGVEPGVIVDYPDGTTPPEDRLARMRRDMAGIEARGSTNAERIAALERQVAELTRRLEEATSGGARRRSAR